MTKDRPYGPYAHLYEQIFEKWHHYKGFNFGEIPGATYPPVSMQFSRPLRWWSWDRPERLRAMREIRDRRLQEIVSLGQKGQNSRMGVSPHPSSPIQQTDKEKWEFIRPVSKGTTLPLPLLSFRCQFTQLEEKCPAT